MADVSRCLRAGALAAVLSIGVLWLGAGASQAAKSLKACRPGQLCQNFNVQVSFKEHRTWTHHTSSINEDCSRFANGNGSDDVELLEAGNPGFTTLTSHPGRFSVASLALDGKFTKLGTATQSLSGPKCAPTTYFPTTWSTVTETGGGTTATEPATGCGTKKVEGKFPSLELKGSTLHLDWNSYASAPAFDPCPDFDGANDLMPDAKSMPNNNFLDVDVKVNVAALQNPKRRKVTAKGTAKYAATENCGTLQGGTCPAGDTYEATGSVEATLWVTFIRTKAHRLPKHL